MNISYLNLIVGLNELLKTHLLLQFEPKLFQTAEDAVMMLHLSALLLSAAICCGAEPITSHKNLKILVLKTMKVLKEYRILIKDYI